jgi:peptidoglycan-N-acetylglucosamine deacetylase
VKRLIPNMTLTAVLFASMAHGQEIAFTFDDGPDMTDAVGLSAEQKNSAILAQLADAHLKSFLFVTRIDNDRSRNALIRQWGERGHLIGNHTATHPDLDEVSLRDYEQDFLRCDRAIKGMPGYARRFRFPYLKEGNTVEKRDGFRSFLDLNAYAAAPVSVDTSDWYYSNRLRDRLKRDPHADRLRYRDAYIKHLDERATYYESLSREVLGRSVAHVMLLHHNLINALFLGDVIRMFRNKGWTVIDADIDFQDPVYVPDCINTSLWILECGRPSIWEV